MQHRYKRIIAREFVVLIISLVLIGILYPTTSYLSTYLRENPGSWVESKDRSGKYNFEYNLKKDTQAEACQSIL